MSALRPGRASLFLTVTALAMVLSACSSPGTSQPSASRASDPPATASPSATASAPPPSPAPGQVQGLKTKEGAGSGEVDLTWTQNVETDVVSYIVYRAVVPGGTPTQLGTASRSNVAQFPLLPFIDPEAQVDYYRVRAVDSAGQLGPMSAEVCGAAPGLRC